MKAVELSLRKLFYFHVLVLMRGEKDENFDFPAMITPCIYVNILTIKSNVIIALCVRWMGFYMAFHVGRVEANGEGKIMVGLCG